MSRRDFDFVSHRERRSIDHREKLLDLIFSDKVNIDKVSLRPRDETRRYVHSCRRFERSGVCRVDSY